MAQMILVSKALLLTHIHMLCIAICVDTLKIVRKSQLKPSVNFLQQANWDSFWHWGAAILNKSCTMCTGLDAQKYHKA